jgi:hypothetical protein
MVLVAACFVAASSAAVAAVSWLLQWGGTDYGAVSLPAVFLVVAVRAWVVEHLLRRRPRLPPRPAAGEVEGAAVVDVRLLGDGDSGWRVVLDEAHVARLDAGQGVRLQVTPGVHDLRVVSSVWDSPPLRVEVRDGDVLRLAAASSGSLGDVLWRPWQALTLSVEPPEGTPEAAARDAEGREAGAGAAVRGQGRRRAVRGRVPAPESTAHGRRPGR